MLRLLGFWFWWGFSLALGGNTTTTSRSTQLYVQPHLSIGSCLDYCHFRFIPFLPCIDDSQTIASSPAEACGRRYCEAEHFELNYKTGGDGAAVESRSNHVERTRLGRWASLRELCLDEKGLPVRRRCEIRNGTTAWQSLSNITCRSTGHKLSSNLHKLAVEAPPDMISRLSDALRQSQEPLHPVDIFSIAQIFESLLEKPKRDPSVVSDLLGVCLHVMATDRETLRLAAQLNATNTLLSNFEDYLDALPPQMVPKDSCHIDAKEVTNVSVVQKQILGHMGVHALISNELSVFFVNPDCANVTGIAVYTEPSDRQGFGYSPLSSTETLESVRAREGLQTAAFLPEPLWRKLKQRGATYLVFKVYTRDSLFVEAESRVRAPSSAVISISIPGMETADNSLPLKLPFFLRTGDTNSSALAGGGCGYWNYETWLSDGISTCSGSSGSSDTPLNPVILCHAHHLTQFSFLLGISKSQTGMDEYEDDGTLDMITNVGLSLSLVGLLAIFLTAALFRSFRRLASTKVLLHLCLALALQTLLFMDIGRGEVLQRLQLTDSCLIAGALMQYCLLVVFSWMLIIGFLQFKRYVTVIGVTHPRHYIFMSALVAWSLPLVPTLLLVKLDPASYRPMQQSPQTAILCYPSGRGLYLGVLLPIALVTLANVLMVGNITCSVYRALNTRGQHVLPQLRLFVLLFFLLGLTWIFGFCSYFQWSRVFAYLFCLTATLQGFVLFVYFVILNKDNRRAWLRLVCNWKSKEERDIVALRTHDQTAFSRTSQMSVQSTSNN